MIDANVLPRVLHRASRRPLTLVEHEEAFASRERVTSLFDELEASGLTGRGGAAFPTARKVQLLREYHGRHKCVVVNAMEGEPASHKEVSLLSSNPHLVIDGAEYLAAMIGAERIDVCVARDNPAAINHLNQAIHERERERERSAKREAKIQLHTPPKRYVAGEESALVHWLNDKESLPQYRSTRPSVLRIGRAPVLVDNAETCANVGLIGRYGARWFRGLGTVHSPGSTLVSVTGALAHPTVLEVALGTPLRMILSAARADSDSQALLLGGYGGSWLDAANLDVAYDNESLNLLGAGVGAGVIVVLPLRGCGILETQRVVRWMANESARQCGPCAFGLPALAIDLAQLTRGSADAPDAYQRLIARCDAIVGRGACHHPDGVVRLVRSALRVFGPDIDQHVNHLPCPGSTSPTHFVPVPSLEREEELQWQ
jgi:NADH:ubiquinone oxidoreductase subunit F (NADH-binding)